MHSVTRLNLSPAQRYLLQAALLPGDDALVAFDIWQKMADLDNLGPGEYDLLPLLSLNLARLDVVHPWLGRIDGVYRRTWYANQLLMAVLVETWSAFRAARLSVLWAGSAAVAQVVTRKTAVSPLHTIELIIPDQAVPRAWQLLHELGWQTKPLTSHCPAAESRQWKSVQRFKRAPHERLWLYWHAVPFVPCVELDRTMWAAAVPLALTDELNALTLDPTDHLFRTLMTAAGGSLTALAWAACLLRQCDIDWLRLMSYSHADQPVTSVHQVLATLADLVTLPNIPDTLTAGRPANARFHERREWAAATTPPSERGWGARFWLFYGRYRRMATCLGVHPGPRSFLRYWQHAHHLPGRWAIPQDALRALRGVPGER